MITKMSGGRADLGTEVWTVFEGIANLWVLGRDKRLLWFGKLEEHPDGDQRWISIKLILIPKWFCVYFNRLETCWAAGEKRMRLAEITLRCKGSLSTWWGWVWQLEFMSYGRVFGGVTWELKLSSVVASWVRRLVSVWKLERAFSRSTG